MLWAAPLLVGAGIGAYQGYKKGGIPGALGGAVVGALPWNKWKVAGMGLGFLGDWMKVIQFKKEYLEKKMNNSNVILNHHIGNK